MWQGFLSKEIILIIFYTVPKEKLEHRNKVKDAEMCK